MLRSLPSKLLNRTALAFCLMLMVWLPLRGDAWDGLSFSGPQTDYYGWFLEEPRE